MTEDFHAQLSFSLPSAGSRTDFVIGFSYRKPCDGWQWGNGAESQILHSVLGIYRSALPNGNIGDL
jgi:hypothetical protein